MARERIEALLVEIRAVRDEVLKELVDTSTDEFGHSTQMNRWDDLRRVLLRFGDHIREHSNQIEDTRRLIDRQHTMPQIMLAEAELAWGKLLGTLVGLTDEDIKAKPSDEDWSVEEVLEHILQGEKNYLEATRRARSRDR